MKESDAGDKTSIRTDFIFRLINYSEPKVAIKFSMRHADINNRLLRLRKKSIQFHFQGA